MNICQIDFNRKFIIYSCLFFPSKTIFCSKYLLPSLCQIMRKSRNLCYLKRKTIDESPGMIRGKNNKTYDRFSSQTYLNTHKDDIIHDSIFQSQSDSFAHDGIVAL